MVFLDRMEKSIDYVKSLSLKSFSVEFNLNVTYVWYN